MRSKIYNFFFNEVEKQKVNELFKKNKLIIIKKKIKNFFFQKC